LVKFLLLNNLRLVQRTAAIVMAEGLHKFHNLGFVHRDLKPSNILVTNKCEFKLADLGLSKMLNCTSSQSLAPNAGTPGYMAPGVLSQQIQTLA
jgi:serine/threonine protein kinase